VPSAASPAVALVDERGLDAAALARLGILQGTEDLTDSRAVLALGWPELERLLPDHGLPRGVVEIASPPAWLAKPTKSAPTALCGGGTTIALAATAARHAADERAWCAWITPEGTPAVYAPAAVQAGVDLERLLVVRPPPAALARTVVKVAASGAFDLVVIDAASGLTGLEGRWLDGRLGERGARRAKVDGSIVVRKLALAAEEKGTACIVLTNAYEARPVPWPVALRLDVERRPEAIAVRVTKDRRGRTSSSHVVRVAC
jgi:recombination protein RecA